MRLKLMMGVVKLYTKCLCFLMNNMMIYLNHNPDYERRSLTNNKLILHLLVHSPLNKKYKNQSFE